jgi:hypothetical protein
LRGVLGHFLLLTRVALATLLLVGCAGSPHDTPPIVCGGHPGTCLDVHIVAHEDDDLLFMNPDLSAGIANGNRVVTVYLTAGTSTDPDYMTRRETGILNAYAFMIDPQAAVVGSDHAPDLLSHWQLHDGAPISIDAGSTTYRAVEYDYLDPLPSGGTVSLVFMRLVEINAVADLTALWEGTAATIASVPCAMDCVAGSVLDTQMIGKDDLISAIEAVIARFDDDSQAVVINTQDATQLFHVLEEYGEGWVDNADHISAAAFAESAFMRHERRHGVSPRLLQQYRGYNISREGVDLVDEQLDKARAFYRYYVLGEQLTGIENGEMVEYTNGDPDHPQFREHTYQDWLKRRYVIGSVPGGSGRLATGDARCALTMGVTLAVGDCADAPRWTLTDQDELQLESDPSRCAVIAADNTASMTSCSTGQDAERQSWVFTATGQIRGAGATCLQGDDAGVSAQPCEQRLDGKGNPLGRAIASQSWSWMK